MRPAKPPCHLLDAASELPGSSTGRTWWQWLAGIWRRTRRSRSSRRGSKTGGFLKAHPFDLVFAANAWHWLDPELRYQRASQALRPHGYLAFWNAVHVLPEDGDPFFVDIQDIYDEIGEAPTGGAVIPRPAELADQRHEIEASGLFDVVDIGRYNWETVYDADGYVELLNTFSGHIAMEAWQRERLYGRSGAALASARMGASVGIGEASSTSHSGDMSPGWCNRVPAIGAYRQDAERLSVGDAIVPAHQVRNEHERGSPT